jgi:hypothetical protein
MARVSRRLFSLQLSAAVGLWAAPYLSRTCGAMPSRPNELKRLLMSTLSDPAGAREIGRQYLATAPDATVAALDLAERVLAKRPANSRELRQFLSRSRDDDLQRRAFVLVDGWVLPQLEAQICALAVLL